MGNTYNYDAQIRLDRWVRRFVRLAGASIGVVCYMVSFGCVGTIEPVPGAGGADDLDAQAILDQATHYRDPTQFVRVSKAPYVTELAGSTAMIAVYVSSDAATAYTTVEPTTVETGAVIPWGSVIVREELDNGLVSQQLTVMAKVGSQHAISDWFFAVADLDGNAEIAGRLSQCQGCHIPHAGNDFVFGVPATRR